MAQAALGDKVVDAAFALLIAAVPVLDSGVLDLCVPARRQLHHRCMQLHTHHFAMTLLLFCLQSGKVDALGAWQILLQVIMNGMTSCRHITLLVLVAWLACLAPLASPAWH